MHRRPRILLVVAPLLVAACGGDDSDGADADSDTDAAASMESTGGPIVEVTISDDGCAPDPIRVSAGPVTFAVTNDGSASVTEFEVLDADDHVLGEVENVVPGDERTFTVTLEPGSYTSYCPNGTEVERGTVDVTPG
jgi:iron uptake system EfeUOB component EfeO/EfeM